MNTLGRHPLAILGVLFVLLRLTAVLTGIEGVAYVEELYRGTIAKEMVAGLKLPLWGYQADDYAAGSLVIGALAAPLYAIFGPRLVVLKVVPLLLSLAALWLMWRLLDGYFGRRAALIGATLVVLAPPTFTHVSLMAMGFHTESVIFSFPMLLCWCRALDDEGDAVRPLTLLGLVAGLAWSFTYITALTAVTCLLCGLVLRPGIFVTRAGAGALLGLVAGLAPWLAYNATHRFLGLDIIAMTYDSPPGSVARNLAMLVGIGMPRSLGFGDVLGIPGAALSYVYAGVVLVAVVALFRRAARGLVNSRDRLLLPFFMYPVLFLAVYAPTRAATFLQPGGTHYDFRFFTPLHALAIPLVAVALARVGVGLLVPLLVIGAVGQAGLLAHKPPRHVLEYRGYSYYQLGQVRIGHLYRSSATFLQAMPFLAQFPDAEARDVFWGLMSSGYGPIRWPGDPREMLTLLPDLPARYRPLFVEAVAVRLASVDEHELHRLADLLPLAPDAYRQPFYMGVAASAASAFRYGSVSEYVALVREVEPRYHFIFHFALGDQFADCLALPDLPGCGPAFRVFEAMDAETVTWIHRGLGRALGVAWLDAGDVHVALARARGRLAPHGRDVAWGVGWSVRQWFREDRARALDAIDGLPGDWRAAAREGLGVFEDWYGLAEPSGRVASRGR